MAFDPDDIKALLEAADPMNVAARSAAATALEQLHSVQAAAGGQTAIAAALAVALASLGFVREAAGDEAAMTAAGMVLGAIADRRDRVMRRVRP